MIEAAFSSGTKSHLKLFVFIESLRQFESRQCYRC